MIRRETLHDNALTMGTCKVYVGGCEECREGVSVDSCQVRKHFHVHHTDPPDIAQPDLRRAARGRPEMAHWYPSLTAVPRKHLELAFYSDS